MKKLQEFWYCVAPQEDIPLYRDGLTDDSALNGLITFLRYCGKHKGEEDSFSSLIERALLHKPAFVQDIRVLLGISDKRFYLDMTYLAHIYDRDGKRLVKEAREDLHKHDTKWFIKRLAGSDRKEWASLIADYFMESGLEPITDVLLPLNEEQITAIYDHLIAPKEVQQRQAKYRGHGAEQLLAQSLVDAGARLYPENKHTDPMAEHDPNVNLLTMELAPHDNADTGIHSFDMVIRDAENDIRVLVQSLIHTSDPGQYGVNKSDETLEVRKLIDRYNERHPQKQVWLMGCVDGVGFSENPNKTIKKMLDAFDCFVQVNTMFKAALFLQEIGLISGIHSVQLDDYFDSEEIKNRLRKKYIEPAGAGLTDRPPEEKWRMVRAGQAWLIY